MGPVEPSASVVELSFAASFDLTSKPMAKSPAKRPAAAAKTAKPARPHLPDPKIPTGPYRPFTSDPGWNEAWWWLGFPILVAAFVIGTYQFAPDFYVRYVIPEGYGILEFSHFLMPLAGLFIAASLLLPPSCERGPWCSRWR